MENRFGVKDFFVFVLLTVIIVMVGLAMKQFDRQYEHIQDIRRANTQLTEDVIRLQQQLASGIVAIGPDSGRGGGGTTRPSELEIFAPLAAAERMPNFARGDWLVDNMGTKIGRLTPLVSSDLYQRFIEYRVMETLLTRHPETLEMIPLLAEGWDERDNSKEWEEYTKDMRAKGMSLDAITEALKKDPKAPIAAEVTFKLRRGVMFSDGTPMTSEDVKFTFDWINNPEVNAPRDRAYLVYLKDIVTNGPHEVTFRFASPYYMNLETVGGTSVMSRKFYGKFKPNDYNERTGLLIGTGAYRLEDPENWAPGKPIELVRNERYWGMRGTFDKMVFREIEDESAEMVMFGNGQFDIMVCFPEQYDKLKADPNVVKMSTHQEIQSPLSGYAYIGWNQKRKVNDKEVPTPFDDVRVRRAMTMLIDRDRMCKEIFLGYATTATGPFDPNGPQSDPSIKPLPFDVAGAKTLLAEAGFADRNGDGIIEGPAGEPLRFKLAYVGASATYQRVAFFLKDAFARAGVVMEPEPLDWPVLLDRIKRGDFDACHLRWGGVVESDAYQIFHSSQIKDQGDNRTSYSNPKTDALIEKARRTIDAKERMKVWQEVHRQLHEDQPYTFMFNQKALRFYNGRIANVGKTKLGQNYMQYYPNPNPWFVPRAKQQYTK